MNRRSAIWILLALLASALAVYLIGNDRVQLWDRDEPRYAQTSREMLQSGDWVVPRFLGEVRTAKPPLIYWAQASVMAVLGDNAFAARLPSALAMIAVLTLLALVIGRAAGRERGVWTAFIFGSTVLAILAAKMSVTDAVLLLWIVIGQLCLYALWRTGPRGWLILLLGISMGLGGLTKGPVAFGVHVTTLIALWLLNWRLEDLNPQGCRRLHWGLVFVGSVMVMSVVATPWLILIQQQEPTFLSHALGHDVVQRIQKGHEGHSGPPGYYVLAVWGTFFPWSLLIPAALVHGWRRRQDPKTRFALAALVGPWVMFELSVGKLPHYILPTYPALAYLSADFLLRAADDLVTDLRSRSFKLIARTMATLAVAGAVAGVGALLLHRPFYLINTIAIIVLLVLAAATSWRVCALLLRHELRTAGLTIGIGMALLVALAYGLLVPRLEPLRISQNTAKILADNDGYAAFGYMIDYKEPSLAFHQGGGLREHSDDNFLSNSTPQQWPEFVVLTERVWRSTAPELQKQWNVIGRVRGLAYNERGGREIVVLKRKPVEFD